MILVTRAEVVGAIRRIVDVFERGTSATCEPSEVFGLRSALIDYTTAAGNVIAYGEQLDADAAQRPAGAPVDEQ